MTITAESSQAVIDYNISRRRDEWRKAAGTLDVDAVTDLIELCNDAIHVGHKPTYDEIYNLAVRLHSIICIDPDCDADHTGDSYALL